MRTTVPASAFAGLTELTLSRPGVANADPYSIPTTAASETTAKTTVAPRHLVFILLIPFPAGGARSGPVGSSVHRLHSEGSSETGCLESRRKSIPRTGVPQEQISLIKKES
jgi:hypothetical protein